MDVRLPNFFIVGAARSGTTALARYLSQHPQVYLSPIKEPSYFAEDIISEWKPPSWDKNQEGLGQYLDGPMRESRGGCVLDWESYLKLFRNVTNEIAVGEASTSYLISPKAPFYIRTAVPEARIVIMLRSPIERAVSTYVMLCRNGRLRASFSEILRSTRSSRLFDWRRMILETRKIAPGVERFLAVFPSGQVWWRLHEDFSMDPAGVVQQLYGFLQVDSTFKPDVSRRHNQEYLPRVPLLHRVAGVTGVRELANRMIPRRARPLIRQLLFRGNPSPSISLEDRQILSDYFAEDVRRLSIVIGRDFSPWLE